MAYKQSNSHNLQRDTLRKIVASSTATEAVKELAAIRIAYSEDAKLLTATINKLIGIDRLYLHHLPTQTSGRWSTWITNWPRSCINTTCPHDEHEWTDVCWSVRDILRPDSDEVLITWDHDNIEGKIHDLIVNDEAAIAAHTEGFDLHTITCCDIFNYEYPSNLKNPHTSEEDSEWRSKYNWQGKDTKQRVLAKNFNHGSKYTESYKFVHKIQGVERYGVNYKGLESLAKRYIVSKDSAWQCKLNIMARIRKERIARTLYGFRRVFFDSSAETGREGFSHIISGTVSDYNNMTLIMLEDYLKEYNRLLHNAHDGDKIAIKKDKWNNECVIAMEQGLRDIIERPITYEGRSLVMTAGIKIYT